MKNIFSRMMKIPNGEVEEIETQDMWVVSWSSRYGRFSGEIKTRFQAFFKEEDAIALKKALNDANKLIGNTSDTDVYIEKKQNGL